MILSGVEIQQRMQTGRVVIDPAPPASNFGPNSVDLHLGYKLVEYRAPWLDWLLGRAMDPKKVWPTREVPLDRYGRWRLKPGRLYLGSTWERAGTAAGSKLVPYLDGRSSLARVGVWAHLAAGRGDEGFIGCWTVELVSAVPVYLRPRDRLFQMSFLVVAGQSQPYIGAYADRTGPAASKGFDRR